MDIDILPQQDPRADADEDLIDYDDELQFQPTPQTHDPKPDNQIASDSGFLDEHVNMSEDVKMNGQEEPDLSYEQGEISNENEGTNHVAETKDANIEDFDLEVTDFDIGDQVQDDPESTHQPDQDMHEIDYDHQDDIATTTHHDGHFDVDEDVDIHREEHQQNNVNHQDDVAPAGNGGHFDGNEDVHAQPEQAEQNNATQNHVDFAETAPEEQHEQPKQAVQESEVPNPPADDANDEIHWDVLDGDDHDTASQDKAVVSGDAATEDQGNDATKAVSPSVTQDVAGTEITGLDNKGRPEDDDRSADEGEKELPEHRVEGGEQEDEQVNSDETFEHHTEQNDTAQSNDGGFPAVTVQYRGDEYPMFSTSSDGFFTDSKIVDGDLGMLLAGLRDELSNEIAAEDELCLQIDELGLEVHESQTRDVLSGITLRQVLEIFDLLVKNQDPANSRVLYTYLFTKPSASKRFEFLSESAAAGKGLDEVMHLFESPIAQVSTIMEDDEEFDGHETPLEHYESVDDDATHAEEGDEAESDTVEQVENHDEIVDLAHADDDTQNESYDTANDDAVQKNDDEKTQKDDDQPQAREHSDEQEASHAAQEAPSVKQDASYNELAPAGGDDSSHHAESKDQSEAEIDPFEELDVNESAEVQDDHFVADDAVTAAPEGKDEPSAEQADVAAPFDVSIQADGTGTEEDATSVQPESTATQSLPAVDLVDEIDYEDDFDTEEVSKELPSSSGKRAHTDAELGADDEQDTKRRRS